MQWKSRISKNYICTLSGREISVGCSFLGAKEIFGIQHDFFSVLSENVSEAIKKAAEEMERKGIWFSGLDGIITFQSQPIYLCLQAICFPEQVLWMMKWNRKSAFSLCFYEKERNCYLAEQKDKSDYDLFCLKELIISKMQEELLREIVYVEFDYCVELSINNLKKAERFLEEFDMVQAEKTLKEELGEDSNGFLGVLKKMILGETDYLSLYWSNYDRDISEVFGFQDDGRLYLKLKDADRLLICYTKIDGGLPKWMQEFMEG